MDRLIGSANRAVKFTTKPLDDKISKWRPGVWGGFRDIFSPDMDGEYL